MRAVRAKEFGGPEVLVPVELPEPMPGPGEVVIDVAYVDTIFVETQVRAGWGREYFAVAPPYVPGGGVSGTVIAAGEGVPDEWLGRRIASFVRDGYASRAVAAVDGATVVPEGVDLSTAAALVHDGVTATGLIELTGVGTGDRVLILGASGGMGTLLVQLAAARGARVVGAARGDEKLNLVRRLGAAQAVDVSDDRWTERAREALGGGADVVLDGVGGRLGAEAFALTLDGGRFSAHGAPTGGFAAVDAEEAKRRGISLLGIGDVQFGPVEATRLRAHALDEVSGGRLRPVIGEVFALERAADAHRAVEERRVLGKVLLKS
ncbi:zinc-binding dehydrogenase [Streptomyces sp. SLBN-31]|uniref:zinc-binding dehydrogenase n=1 Tax=Streptomyces sp. SLBN-31 TaxID=2768444 RepID=UPI00114EBA7E|nr:zinc-binding dehydrogenase [Streptomyces sp. SLBN-31]TQJ74909.1 NADPH2:quinone reductase [Streptomyces sp. SLBN-31]